jgi:hypothetical protein
VSSPRSATRQANNASLQEPRGRGTSPRNNQEVEERRTSPVELLWDLVFVFALTQVTTLLSHDLSWAGFGRGMLVFALLWWAWSAFVWAANAEQEESHRRVTCRALEAGGGDRRRGAGLAHSRTPSWRPRVPWPPSEGPSAEGDCRLAEGHGEEDRPHGVFQLPRWPSVGSPRMRQRTASIARRTRYSRVRLVGDLVHPARMLDRAEESRQGDLRLSAESFSPGTRMGRAGIEPATLGLKVPCSTN